MNAQQEYTSFMKKTGQIREKIGHDPGLSDYDEDFYNLRLNINNIRVSKIEEWPSQVLRSVNNVRNALSSKNITKPNKIRKAYRDIVDTLRFLNIDLYPVFTRLAPDPVTSIIASILHAITSQTIDASILSYNDITNIYENIIIYNIPAMLKKLYSLFKKLLTNLNQSYLDNTNDIVIRHQLSNISTFWTKERVECLYEKRTKNDDIVDGYTKFLIPTVKHMNMLTSLRRRTGDPPFSPEYIAERSKVVRSINSLKLDKLDKVDEWCDRLSSQKQHSYRQYLFPNWKRLKTFVEKRVPNTITTQQDAIPFSQEQWNTILESFQQKKKPTIKNQQGGGASPSPQQQQQEYIQQELQQQKQQQRKWQSFRVDNVKQQDLYQKQIVIPYRHNNAVNMQKSIVNRKQHNIPFIHSSMKDKKIVSTIMKYARQNNFTSIIIVDVRNKSHHYTDQDMKHLANIASRFQRKYIMLKNNLSQLLHEIPEEDKENPLYILIDQGAMSNHIPEVEMKKEHDHIFRIKVSCRKKIGSFYTDCSSPDDNDKTNPMDDYVVRSLYDSLEAYNNKYIRNITQKLSYHESNIRQLDEYIRTHRYHPITDTYLDMKNSLRTAIRKLRKKKSINLPSIYIITNDLHRDWIRNK